MPVEQHAARGAVDLVPAHVRQDGGLQLLDDAGPLAAALGVVAVLDAAVEQDLHADADAEHRAAAGEPAADDLGPSTALQPSMQAAKAPTPGTTRPSASRAACGRRSP